MSDTSRIPVCILTSQYFGWGTYGGFGSMSRKLAEMLAGNGWEVEVIVPRRHEQEPEEIINEVKVRSFPVTRPEEARRLLRASPARIFHSQDPTVLTALAQDAHPGRVHIVTCRDPRDRRDWWTEFRFATMRRRILTPLHLLTESGPIVAHGVRHADAVYVPAHFLRTKVQRMYGLPEPAGFMPNLIDVPDKIPPKPPVPVLTFLGRWDKRKRLELFLSLAAEFPLYRFVAAGGGSAAAESGYAEKLRRQFSGIPNLELPGFINRFTQREKMEALLDETWVLVNTAAREGLPLTFLEAAAHGCAILSAVNPDDFAERFGVHVKKDDFAGGLRRLLAASPAASGAAAHAYVRSTYECHEALNAHEEEYHRHARRKGL